MAGAGHHLYTASCRNTGLALSGQLTALQDHHQPTDLLRIGGAAAQFDHLLPPTSASFRPPHHPTSAPFFLPNFHHDVDQNTTSLMQTKHFSGSLLPLPETAGSSSSSSVAAAAAGLFNLGFFSNNNSNNNISADQLGNGNGGDAEAPATLFSGDAMIDNDGGGHGHIPPLYNETALPQMSATALLQKAAQMGATTSSNGGAFLRAFGSSSSSSNKSDRPPASSSFLPATMRSQMETDSHLQDLMNSLANGGSDGLTRDFLGVGGIMRSIGGEHGGGHGRQHGIDISSLDGDMKSKAGGMRHSFGGGSLL